MAVTVDNRIVEMEFDNAQFEKNVATSIETLDKLKEALKLEDSAKAFNQLDANVRNVSFAPLEKAIDNINSKFTVFGKVADDFKQKIANMITSTATNIYKNTIGQIKTGGMTRAMNIEQAKFQLKGLGIAWDAVSDSINTAVDGTAYGLDSAAKAASQLSASGVALGDDMTKALRGISGVAAMTNSSYDDIARIFTTVAGNGRVMTMQLNQIGMRGVNAAAELSKAMGVTEAELREMVTKGKVDFQTFANAMDDAFGEHAKDANATFSGAMSNVKAALSRIGALFATPYMDNMIAVFNALRVAINGVKAAIEPLAGQFERVMQMFSKWASSVLENERTVSGLKNIITGFINILDAIVGYLVPFGQIILDLIPERAITKFRDLTEAFKDFTAKLIPSKKTLDAIYSVLRGVIDVAGLFLDIIKGVVKAFIPANIQIANFGDGLTTGLQTIGDFMSGITKFIRQTGLLDKAVAAITIGIKTFVGSVSTGITAIKNFITYISQLETTKTVMNVLSQAFTIALGLIIIAINQVREAITNVVEFVKSYNIESFPDVLTMIGDAFDKLKERITNFFGSFKKDTKDVKKVEENLGEGLKTISGHVDELEYQYIHAKWPIKEVAKVTEETNDVVVDKTNVMMTTLKKFFDYLKPMFSNILSWVQKLNPGQMIALAFAGALLALILNINKAIKSFSTMTGAVTTVIKAFQRFVKTLRNSLRMGTIERMAYAITILAGAILVLAYQPWQKLAKGAIVIGGLAVALGVLGGVFGKFKMAQLNKNSNGLLRIAAAIGIMAAAMVLLQTIDETEFQYAAASMILIVSTLGAFAIIVSEQAPEISKGCIGLVAVGLSLIAAAGAFMMLSTVPWEKLGPGLLAFAGVTSMLGLLVIAITELPWQAGLAMLAAGGGVMLMVTSLGILALELLAISYLPFNDILKTIPNFIGVFGALAILMTMAHAASGASIKGASAILILTAALGVMAGLFKQLYILVSIMDFWTAIATIGLMTTLIVELGLLMFATNVIAKDSIKAGANALLVAGALAVLAFTLGQLAESKGRLGAALGCMVILGLVMAGMMAVSKLTEKAKPGPILALVAALSVIFAELSLVTFFTDEEMQRFKDAASSLFVVLLGIAGELYLLGKVADKIKKETLIAMGIQIAQLVVVAGALYLLAEFDVTTIGVTAASLCGVLLAMAGEMVLISKLANDLKKESLIAMVVMILQLGAAAGALYMLASVPWENLIAGSIALGLIMVAMGGAAALAKGVGIEAAIALDAISIALLPLAYGLNMIAQIDEQKVGSVLGLLVVTGITMGALGAAAQSFTLGFGVATLAMIGFGLAFIEFGAGAKLFGEGAEIVVDAFTRLGMVARPAANEIAYAIKTIVTSIGEGVAGAIVAFGSTLVGGIVGGLSAAVAAVLSFVKPVFNAAASFVGGIVGGIKSVIGKPVELIKGLMTDMSEPIKGQKSIFESNGKDVLLGLLDGLTNTGALGLIKKAVQTVSKSDVIDEMANGLGTHSASEYTTNQGEDVDQGLVNGMFNLLGKVKDTATNVAGGAIEGMQNTLTNGIPGLSAATSQMGTEGILNPLGYIVELGKNKLNGLFGMFNMYQNMLGKVRDSGEPLSDAEKAGQMKQWQELRDSLKQVEEEEPDPLSGGTSGGSGGSSKASEKVKELMDVEKETADVSAEFADRFSSAFSYIDDQDYLLKIQETLENFGYNLDTSSKDYDKLKETIGEDSSAISASLKMAFAEMEKEAETRKLDTISRAMDNFADFVFETSDDYLETVKGMEKGTEDYLEAMKKAWDEYGKALKSALELDPLEAFSNEWTVKTKDLLKNMQSNMRAMEQFDIVVAGVSERFAELRLSPEILNELVKTGYKALPQLTGMLQATDDELIQLTTTLEDFKERSQKLPTHVMASLALAVDAYKTSVANAQDGTNEFIVTMEQLERVSERVTALVIARYDQMYDKISSVLESQIDIFSEFTEDEEDALSPSELFSYLDQNTKGVKKWRDNLGKVIEKGLDDSVIQKLVDLGPKSAKELEAFAQMTTTQIQQYNEKYAKLMELEDDAAKNIAYSYSVAGKNVVEGFAKGLEETGMAKDAAMSLANQSLDELKKVLDINSPSGVTLKYGLYVVEGLRDGIKNAVKTVIDPAKNLADTVINTILKYIKLDEIKKIGANICNTLADSINANTGRVQAAATKLANVVKSATEAGVEIGSPSKWAWRVGRFIDQGLANGLTDNADTVEDSMYNMTDLIKRVKEVLDGELEYDPTIKPVLDLSNVTGGMNDLNNLLNQNATISMARNISASGRMVDVQGLDGNTNNTQTISINNYVYGAQGQDPNELVDVLNYKLGRQLRRLEVIQ